MTLSRADTADWQFEAHDLLWCTQPVLYFDSLILQWLVIVCIMSFFKYEFSVRSKPVCLEWAVCLACGDAGCGFLCETKTRVKTATVHRTLELHHAAPRCTTAAAQRAVHLLIQSSMKLDSVSTTRNWRISCGCHCHDITLLMFMSVSHCCSSPLYSKFINIEQITCCTLHTSFGS